MEKLQEEVRVLKQQMRDTQTDRERERLEFLKQPVKVELTKKRKKEEEAREKARDLYESVLKETRERHNKYWDRDRAQEDWRRFLKNKVSDWPEYQGKGKWASYERAYESRAGKNAPRKKNKNQLLKDIPKDGKYFKLLDLPIELRLMIYEFYFQGERERKVPSYYISHGELNVLLFEDPEKVSFPPLYIRKWTKFPHFDVYRRLVEYPHERKELDTVVHRYCQQYIIDGHICFGEWRRVPQSLRCSNTAKLYPHRCSICGHTGKNHIPDYIRVNEYGHLVDNLAPLCLVNRRIFADMWCMLVGVHAKFEASISSFKYGPLFRFIRMFKRLCGITITYDKVRLTLSNFSRAASFYQQGNVTIPIEQWSRDLEIAFRDHWFRNFPLWPVVCDNSTPELHLILEHWMNFVRQTAALYRLDPHEWEKITRPYVSRLFVQTGLRSDGEDNERHALIEDCLSMLCNGAKYHFFMGRWPVKDCLTDGNLSSAKGYRALWTHEHAYFKVIEEYRQDIDTALRRKLGELYDDWVALRKQETVPDEGVI